MCEGTLGRHPAQSRDPARPAPRPGERREVAGAFLGDAPFALWSSNPGHLGVLNPRVPVIGAVSRSPGFGAAPSPDKWDWICGFVAQSQGNISKAGNKSPGRIKRSSGWLEKRFEAFYCARSSPAHHKLASALALFYLPLGSCPSLPPYISPAADRLQFGEQPNSIARKGQPASSLAPRPGGLEFLFLGGRGLRSRTHASKLGDRPEKAGSREPRRDAAGRTHTTTRPRPRTPQVWISRKTAHPPHLPLQSKGLGQHFYRLRLNCGFSKHGRRDINKHKEFSQYR
ncbi:uncharacterized protein LOC121474690 [Vulpes lagopus]|uniref:uncharacterized protein LOC121474690 n=1 Tax=Vulpes lagopus TaxID=494514 RepID=UPI001BCA031E|nr:uncharacterized protein LOC121474690 [Vulpes lagopus]